MPTFEIETQDGRKFHVEADKPPTEQELASAMPDVFGGSVRNSNWTAGELVHQPLFRFSRVDPTSTEGFFLKGRNEPGSLNQVFGLNPETFDPGMTPEGRAFVNRGLDALEGFATPLNAALALTGGKEAQMATEYAKRLMAPVYQRVIAQRPVEALIKAIFGSQSVQPAVEAAGRYSVTSEHPEAFPSGELGADAADVVVNSLLAGSMAGPPLVEAFRPRTTPPPSPGWGDIPGLRFGDVPLPPYPRELRQTDVGEQVRQQEIGFPRPMPLQLPERTGTRFAVDPLGQAADLSQLSPAEQTELFRGPKEFVPREQYVRPAQAAPVVIGEQQPQGLPAPQPASQMGEAGLQALADRLGYKLTPKEEQIGGQISFAAPAEAGGIPSARQAASGKDVSTEQERLMRGQFVPQSETSPEKGVVPQRTQPAKTLAELRTELERGSRNREAGGIDMSIFEDVVDYGKRLYAKGKDFAGWSADMVRDLGEHVRPYLDESWKNVHRIVSTRPDQPFVMAAGELVASPTKLKAPTDKEGRYDAGQAVARLRNSLGDKSGEWEILKNAGIEKQFPPGQRVSPESLRQWVDKNGPKVEVRVLRSGEGKDVGTEAGRRVGEIQHHLETYYSGPPQEGKDVYRISGPNGSVTRFAEYDPKKGDYQKVEELAPEQIPDKKVRDLMLEYREKYKVWDNAPLDISKTEGGLWEVMLDTGEKKTFYTKEAAEQFSKESKVTRKNLIFRNPDGTPKTTASGMSYDLSKVAEAKESKAPMTMFGKDKPTAPPTREGVKTRLQTKTLQYSRVSGANVSRALDLLGASMYDKKLSSTIIKETVQNAFDALKETSNGQIRMEKDSDRRALAISDNGKGMTPEEVVTKLLPAFESGKDAESSAGGYGLAKIALFANTESFEVRTVTDTPSGKIQTDVRGTRQDWLNFVNQGAEIGEDLSKGTHDLAGIKVSSHPVDVDTPTGTRIEMILPEGKYDVWDARRTFERIGENEPGRIEFVGDTGEIIEKTKAATAPVQKKIATAGADVEIMFDPSEPASKQWDIPVMNHGLKQFDMSFGEDVKTPTVLINVKPKVDVTNSEYPFTNNRDSLKGETGEKVRAFLKEMANEYKQIVIKKFASTLKGAERIQGSNQRFLDISGKLSQDDLAEITSNPYIRQWNKRLANIHKDAFAYLNKRHGDFWTNARYKGFANGGGFYGVRFGTPAQGTAGEIYYDLGAILRDAAKDVENGKYTPEEQPLAVGERLAGVMLHEVAHQISSYEGETHAVAMTDLAGHMVQAIQKVIKATNKVFPNYAELQQFHKWYADKVSGAELSESEARDFVREGQRDKEQGQVFSGRARQTGTPATTTTGSIGTGIKAAVEKNKGGESGGPDFTKAIVDMGDKALKGAKEFLKKPLSIDELVEVVLQTKTPLPGLQDKQVANKVFSRPFAAERVPVLGRMLGGRGRIQEESQQALATWYHERYGVAPAVSGVLGEQIMGKVDNAFKTTKEGDLNVGRTLPTQSLKMSDVFEGLQRDPNSYKLSDHQQAVWTKTVKPILARMNQLIDEYKLADIKDEHGHLNAYFPRIVTERTKTPVEVKPLKVGAKQSFQFERDYPTEEAGWKGGVKYSTSVEQRLVANTERLYKAMADKRLANDPLVQPRSRQSLKASLKEAYAEELGSGKMTDRDINNIVAQLSARGTVNQPAFFGKVFDAKTADILNKEFGSDTSKLRRVFANGNSFLKAVQLGFDFGVGQLQLLPTLYRNPGVWAKAQWLGLESVGSKQFFADYIRKNLADARELAQLGSSVGRLQEMMEGLRKGQPLTKIPGVGQLAQAFGRQFQTTLDVAKIELWKAWKEVTPKKEWPMLIQAIESQLGAGRMESSMVSSKRALTERVFTLAPSYYRGAVNFIASLGSSKVDGKVARRAMGAFMVGSLALYYSMAKQTGMSDEEIKKRLNPANPAFLMWQVEQNGKLINIGIGGIYRSLLRLVGNMVATSIEHPENWLTLRSDKNPITRWYRGHAGPLIGLAWDYFSGKDFLNRDVTAKNLPASLAPLALQDAVRPSGQEKTLAEYSSDMMGLSSYQDKGRMANLERMSGKKVSEMTLNERADAEKAYKAKFSKMTDTEKLQAAERKMQGNLERKNALAEDLPDNITDWLKRQNLEIHGFSPEFSHRGTKIHLTEDETEEYQKKLVEAYTKFLGPWVGKTVSQKQLDARIEQARLWAKARLRQEMLHPSR